MDVAVIVLWYAFLAWAGIKLVMFGYDKIRRRPVQRPRGYDRDDMPYWDGRRWR